MRHRENPWNRRDETGRTALAATGRVSRSRAKKTGRLDGQMGWNLTPRNPAKSVYAWAHRSVTSSLPQDCRFCGRARVIIFLGKWKAVAGLGPVWGALPPLVYLIAPTRGGANYKRAPPGVALKGADCEPWALSGLGVAAPPRTCPATTTTRKVCWMCVGERSETRLGQVPRRRCSSKLVWGPARARLLPIGCRQWAGSAWSERPWSLGTLSLNERDWF